MRKRTVRTGLRLLTFSIMLLLLGTFYGQQINIFLDVAGDGTVEFVKLAFFWGAVLGAAAILMILFGMLQRSVYTERIRLLPSLFILLLLVTVFFTLFYRSLSAPPQQKPLRPGETLII
jgi:glucan phosphoethanolaminetransferase (alkaline phosphatase superfamily)